MSERVRVEVADHVAVVTLTRPDKHNALDLPMFEGIVAAAERLMTEPGVRAVVLHGEGPSFCSGLDLAGVMGAGEGIDHLDRPAAGRGAQSLPAAGLRLDPAAGAGDRGDPRKLPGRGPADRAWRRHPLRHAPTHGCR